MLLIMFNHHTLKKVKLHYLHMGALCFLSALQNAVPYRRLSPDRLCVTLRKLSVCRELRPAVSWRLWLDHMLLFTWSLQVLPVSHPNSRGRLVRSKCSWQCKCAFICVCVLTSALIHVSLHLLMSSAGRNTIWAVVCGKGFTLIFYLQEDCRRLIHSDVIQDSCKVLSLQGINNVWGKF